MSRPLLQKGISELEKLFASNPNDVKILKSLKNELNYRQVPRAVALLKAVEDLLSSESHSDISSQIPLFTPIETYLEPTKTTPTPPEHFNSKSESIETSLANQDTLLTLINPQDAYKILNVSTNTSWELIEKARGEIVELSNPHRMKNVSVENQRKVQLDAKRANAAYTFLLNYRTNKLD